MFKKYWAIFRGTASTHKVLSILVFVVIVTVGWWLWSTATSTSGQTRYTVSNVAQNAIISVVTASGQITADQQLDVKPKVSGQVTSVGVTVGSRVGEGTLLAVIDPADALKAVRDAQANLDNANLALTKLQQPATTATLTQQQNAISQAQQTLATQYQSGFGDITSTFLDLPAIITSLQDINLGTASSNQNSQWNIDFYKDQALHYNPLAIEYRDAAYNDNILARKSYDQTFTDFKSLTSTPDQATIEKMLTETFNTTSNIATAAKSSYDLIQFYSDQLTQNNVTPKTLASTQITNLNTFQSKLQTHLTNLLSDKNNLATNKNSIVEKQQALEQINAGANTVDVQTSQLTISQRQNALTDAKVALDNYYIRAPFNGTVAALSVHKFDQISSGTIIASLITPKQLATLSLNEVDAAKIKIGDKATLTFDAIPNLTLTGTIAEIDPVGAVTQGVVSYTVKIALDTQNTQVKAGMTVNARIQIAVHQNVLTVPQSAVKTQNGQKYILAFIPSIASSTVAAAGSLGIQSKAAPKQIPIEVGISDDTNVEVTSGLTVGEQVVVRSIVAGAKATTPAATSGGGNNRGGGIRIP